jgi:hypothetical protein
MTRTDRRKVMLEVPPQLLERIEDCWHRERMQSRHATMLWLLEKALDVVEPPRQHPDQLVLDLEVPEGRS